MTYIPETLRQASEALQQASAALTTVAQAMEDAPGPEPSVAASQEVEPQPDAFPEPGTPRTGGWIAYRVPTRKDADANGQVVIPSARQGGLSLRTRINFCFVHPGTPWCPSDHIAAPWDPTCLDRNGWIRSRFPTVEDTGSTGHVLIPVGYGDTTSTIAYHLIVPSQPWAPWGSSPGRFEK